MQSDTKTATNSTDSSQRRLNSSTKLQNPATRLQPSLTSTANRTLCRVCMDDDQTTSTLIRPCNCKGTVGYIHSACLEKWVETTHNMNCEICASPYELESCGWKAFSDFSMPRPLSNEWEDVLDFRCAIAWLIYISRFLYLQISYGHKETMRQISEAVGENSFASLWWFAFWMNFAYYGSITILIMEQFVVENSTYRFKNKDHQPLRTPIDNNNNTTSQSNKTY